MMRQFLSGLFIIACVLSASGQKVGLVLSGGGSRGLAHIGVLKALEDNDIPIDYIAGTSMGAIVGGLYAAGYSPEEIALIVNSGEFRRWASGKLDEKYIYFFKQPPPDASWITMKFDYDSTFQTRFPTSIIAPYQMDFAVVELFSRADALAKGNFDSLFVPFRCVGADIEAGKAVTFSNGNLGKSIRASMTFPFYFKPIKINGKLIFDGGIYNNFPTDVMTEDFNPDFIIGSAVVQNFDPPDEDNVLSHIENMITSKTNYEEIGKNGVLIKPNVRDISILDFSNPAEIIDSGYWATIHIADSLKKMIMRRLPHNELRQRRMNYRRSQPPLIFGNIVLDGIRRSQRQYISRLLLHRRDSISLEELKHEYFRLVSDDKFAYIFPEVEYNPQTGFFDLKLNVKVDKKLQGSFGGNMSSSVNSTAFAAFQYKYLRSAGFTLSSNLYFGKFYSSLLVRGRLDFPSRVPFYLQGDVVYNRWDYFKSSGAFFQNVRPSYLVMGEQYSGLAAAMPVTNESKLVIGINQENLTNKYYMIDDFRPTDTSDVTTIHCLSPYLTFERNTHNRKQFASKGSLFMIRFRHVVGNERNYPGSTSLLPLPKYKYEREWVMGKVLFDHYFNTKRKFVPGIYAEAVYSTQKFFNNYTSTILMTPVFQPLPESKALFLENFRSQYYAAFGAKALYSFTNSLDFRLEAYIFQPYRSTIKNPDNTADFGLPFASRYYMAGTALVYNSPVGPVSLSFNYYHKYYKNYSFMFNFGYIIFNDRALD